jgi:Uma2 family endonuclease
MTAQLERSERLTKLEWRELEKQTGLRYEYLDGFVYAMAGESRRHNEIVQNLIEVLRPITRARRCKMFIESVSTEVDGGRSYYYPDLVVTCDPSDDDPYEIRRPCLIVEVLSPSTAGKDKREKLKAYTDLPTLERYILIDQEARRVEVYRKHSWNWTYQELEGDGEFDVPCLGVSVTLEGIYAGLG